MVPWGAVVGLGCQGACGGNGVRGVPVVVPGVPVGPRCCCEVPGAEVLLCTKNFKKKCTKKKF